MAMVYKKVLTKRSKSVKQLWTIRHKAKDYATFCRWGIYVPTLSKTMLVSSLRPRSVSHDYIQSNLKRCNRHSKVLTVTAKTILRHGKQTEITSITFNLKEAALHAYATFLASFRRDSSSSSWSICLYVALSTPVGSSGLRNVPQNLSQKVKTWP
mmetsp:Transcript_1379/g.3067  ORF Transcript_1379/g.3067 Transcript_1379/m.3067 type:complete len:155 (-) Transcript_1379:1290-1754(-)